MKYWNVQNIVHEYVCPVQMVTQVIGEMTAPDIFNANREDVRELQEACEIVAQVCRARQEIELKNLKRRFGS